MKVILLQKVPGLGDIDQIKEVADGYARNFLFPNHLAVQASTAKAVAASAHKQKLAKEAELELRAEQSLADKLDGMVLEIKEKVSEKGQLYAAVSSAKISSELKKRDLNVERGQIAVPPIKEPGEYSASVKLKHGLEASLTIIVSA